LPSLKKCNDKRFAIPKKAITNFLHSKITKREELTMSMQNAIKNLRAAPDNTLIVLLLKQFKDLLEQHGVKLEAQTIHAIANQAAERQALSDLGEKVKLTLIDIIDESLNLLQERFNLTFAKSLVANAHLLTGWKTPTEFQEAISQKNNAETRIAMGSALLAMLGDTRFVAYVFTTLEHEYVRGHMEAMLAMRAISHAAETDPGTDDWESKTRAALLTSE
jgi:hypothetical protein